MTPHAIPYRALLRQEKGPFKPSTCGNRFSLGMWTSSMRIMPVILARSDNLPLMGGHSRPFIPFSRRNPRILPSHLHFAQTTQRSAIGELVIHVLEPDME